MRNRDDFSPRTRLKLAQRACYFCSNPDCRRITSGPNLQPDKSTILGEAAHICGAAPGGPRYNADMTRKERSSIENGIWLCRICSKLVDSDEKQYPSEVLKRWKVEHETMISKEMLNPELIKKAFVEGVPEQVTVKALVDAGFAPDKVYIIVSALEEASQKKNVRLTKFLTDYIDKDLANVPPFGVP